MLCYDCIQEPKVQKRKKYRRKQTAKQKKSNRQNEGGTKRWYAEALTKNKGEVQNECNQ